MVNHPTDASNAITHCMKLVAKQHLAHMSCTIGDPSRFAALQAKTASRKLLSA
jgi:hypothetical protein